MFFKVALVIGTSFFLSNSVQSQIPIGIGNGAKLLITNADNAAKVFISVDGGPENPIADIPYRDNDPIRNDFISIVPVNSGFLKVYKVRVELRNEVNTSNINPLHFNAYLYSVGRDDISIDEVRKLAIQPQKISFKSPGQGYSGVVHNIIFTVQKK